MPCPNYRRKQTISKAFRVSREESECIELLAKAAGVTQQEYIMAKIEDKEFTVVPDIRTYKDAPRHDAPGLPGALSSARPIRRHRWRRVTRRAREGRRSDCGNGVKTDEQ